MNDIEALTNRVIVIGHGKKLYDGSLNGIKKKFNKEKKLEIIYKKLTDIPKIKGVNVLEKTNNKVLLSVNTENNSISKIVREYSKVSEIEDVNVLNDNIDDIIIKLYKEYDL